MTATHQVRKWLAATFATPEQVPDLEILGKSHQTADGQKQRGPADTAIGGSGDQDRDLHREDLPEDVQDTDDGDSRGGVCTFGGEQRTSAAVLGFGHDYGQNVNL